LEAENAELRANFEEVLNALKSFAECGLSYPDVSADAVQCDYVKNFRRATEVYSKHRKEVGT
jgi:hypothetical protein